MGKTSWIHKALMPPKFAARRVRRCSVCGRRRGYIRDFGLCRLCFRAMAHRGELPGVRKASW
ncbi:MAG: type Z 30S ribosomal protein S14 [Candidatus Bipolaricaulota bacterium]|nr:type Z 30S ribosomal protein S14 [Candidatus Bipolaricaulota bacterium]MCS7275061.1 type Z 30S ribosomal protein S14 [Candidatus Bipolaricaulota bacterium]MDW8110389.1 type Z 30S ribosomal protein S14 [Candidatus Bipolaricaulota bacterium]MDW8329540.1 type Z 30S ribosomal protein S14 [Candidatus Bipolaricaulota bacterium]